MAEQHNSIRTFETSVDFEGKDYAVQYSVISGSVLVNSVVGKGACFMPHLSTHIDTSAVLTARILARKLLEGAKERGTL
ncbi:MAG: hypothetical protein ABSD38_07065 [Syntrophorhabdales bacterium]|jgi:hypothetical protein